MATAEIPSLMSNQEENDTGVILYVKYAEDEGFKSDIFFILLHHAHNVQVNIHVDIGVGKKRKFVDVTDLGSELGKEFCTVLLCFYVFTGEDCSSAFKGKGKVAPLKKLMKAPKFYKAFRLVIPHKHCNAVM